MAKNKQNLNQEELKKIVEQVIMDLSKTNSSSEKAKEFIGNDKFRQEAYGVLKDLMGETMQQEITKIREENKKDIEACLKVCKNMDNRFYRLENKVHNLKRDIRDLKKETKYYIDNLEEGIEYEICQIQKQVDSLKLSTKYLKQFIQALGETLGVVNAGASFKKTVKKFKKFCQKKRNSYNSAQYNLTKDTHN